MCAWYISHESSFDLLALRTHANFSELYFEMLEVNLLCLMAETTHSHVF